MYRSLKLAALLILALTFTLSAQAEPEAPQGQLQGPAGQAPTPTGQIKPATEQTNAPAGKAGASRELVKGLDEQVQEIKTDVLSIAAQLNQLEEKLIYPSDTQVAVFVSLAKGETFRLDGVDVGLDGASVAHHLYTYKELEALRKGGVQRIFVGNVRTGDHALKVTVLGKSTGGSDFRKEQDFKVAKGVGPKLVGVVLADNGKTVTLKDW